MQVDFYQLTRDPAEKLLPTLAQRTLDAGERMLIVSDDFEQIEAISAALWTSKAESFLAHALAGGERDADQPILLSQDCEPANNARFVALADGQWRDVAPQTTRVFYLFAPDRLDDARAAWRTLDEDIDRRYWKQDGRRWVEGP